MDSTIEYYEEHAVEFIAETQKSTSKNNCNL